MSTHSTFSLLTFNCFGGYNWTTPRRLRSLARELDEIKPQVVCLQEVQSNLALRLLLRAAAIYPAHAYLPGLSAPLGSLLTLARAQLHSPHFARYQTQGAWFGPTIMDQLTRKGMLISRTQQGTQSVIVINTHLVANYMANWQPDGRAARDQQQQLQQLAATVRAQPADAIVVVAGDFNIPRGSWLYEEFLEESGLQDPLAGDERPTYRPFPGVPVRYALPIDFVFVRTPPALAVHTEGNFCFTDQFTYVGGGQGYLSDHLGVRLKLQWDTNAGQAQSV
ncbi:MAG: endonuclease/exonuclease/phosphatase family protein [Caldilineaceae bacterium]|nr:endonuclease/exonuclease/phosphatase family protein [Caldilineaceae bacterium]